ncbi:MAG: SAM-dependent chlorinase/fluorinase [Gammaproteobacteria bacterium]|nr:SAM-dependent chlorinase/fluorinase [Gammaproteobacteria bacterium]
MIFLFTDFGYQGSYVGQMKAVLAQQVPNQAVIDLMHDAPMFNPKASAYLLASLIPYLPERTIILGVVDPGVGDHHRRPIMVKADSRWYIGPDNGLFNTVIKQANKAQVWEINWKPQTLSNSFHGRDLFAPIAAMLAEGKQVDGKELTTDEIVPVDWPEQLNEIIYVDHYGNAMTGLSGEQMGATSVIKVEEHEFMFARTFSEVNKGEGFWYVNSNGLIEVAVNQGSSVESFGLGIGDRVEVL